jgi:hypothetical protein
MLVPKGQKFATQSLDFKGFEVVFLLKEGP